MASGEVLFFPSVAVGTTEEGVGDGTLEQMYRTFGPVVHRRCLGLLGDAEDALDAVHDVFVIVREKLDTFRGDSEPLTWIYRIATNLCLNRIRDQKTHARLVSKIGVDDAVDPTPAIERRILLSQLSAMFSPRQMQILVHRYYDDMTQQEIGEMVELSERSIRTELKVIHETAREKLDQFESLREADDDD